MKCVFSKHKYELTLLLNTLCVEYLLKSIDVFPALNGVSKSSVFSSSVVAGDCFRTNITQIPKY